MFAYIMVPSWVFYICTALILACWALAGLTAFDFTRNQVRLSRARKFL